MDRYKNMYKVHKNLKSGESHPEVLNSFTENRTVLSTLPQKPDKSNNIADSAIRIIPNSKNTSSPWFVTNKSHIKSNSKDLQNSKPVQLPLDEFAEYKLKKKHELTQKVGNQINGSCSAAKTISEPIASRNNTSIHKNPDDNSKDSYIKVLKREFDMLDEDEKIDCRIRNWRICQ